MCFRVIFVFVQFRDIDILAKRMVVITMRRIINMYELRDHGAVSTASDDVRHLSSEGANLNEHWLGEAKTCWLEHKSGYVSTRLDSAIDEAFMHDCH